MDVVDDETFLDESTMSFLIGATMLTEFSISKLVRS